MTGLGVFFRDANPLIIDIQLDTSRGVATRTGINMAAANNHAEKIVKRHESMYTHLANNVNTWA